MAEVDFNYFLSRKYAQLQQQADATTTNARATAQNAATNALTGAAGAALDRMKTELMPRESAASVARLGAEANLANQQASVVVPESRARIRGMDADTALTGTQNKVLTRTSLTPMQELFGSSSEFNTGTPLGSVFGTQFRAPRMQDYDRKRGGLTAAGLDYINGF